MSERVDKTAIQEQITTNAMCESNSDLGNCDSAAKYERETLQLSLEEANAKLEHVFESQRVFINMIDHEFRTTLTGIQGFSELLCEEELTLEEVKTFARDIRSDAVRLSSVITRFLNLEYMKSSKATLRWDFVNFNEILRTVAERTQHLISKHIIHVDLDETLPQIRGDQMKLTQLVEDLVANALKYSPSGGEILLKSCREGTVIQISIQDQGIGIPSHALETIFNAFSHIYVDKTQYVPGVGLGLPIVKQIVNLHGGHIWVESTLGEGSCFRITFPILDDTVVVHHESV